jgi:hypothetical protein
MVASPGPGKDRFHDGEQQKLAAGIHSDDPQALDFVCDAELAFEGERDDELGREGAADIDLDAAVADADDDAPDELPNDRLLEARGRLQEGGCESGRRQHRVERCGSGRGSGF